jgi:GH18 family chitinase
VSSVASTIDYLLELGAKPEKTVLGVPFYGRTFVLDYPKNNEVGARSRFCEPPFRPEVIIFVSFVFLEFTLTRRLSNKQQYCNV